MKNILLKYLLYILYKREQKLPEVQISILKP
jgi:hypothetical protein